MKRTLDSITMCLGEHSQVTIHEQLQPDPILFQMDVIALDYDGHKRVNLRRQDAEEMVAYLTRVLAKPMTAKEKEAIERERKYAKENGDD